MTFEGYCEIVQDSVITEGYNSYFPSAYVFSESEEKLHVLDCELTEGGEEEVALGWIEQFTEPLYVAFRGGDRNIFVCHFVERELVGSLKIHVDPYED